jgi:hypothetical protein
MKAISANIWKRYWDRGGTSSLLESEVTFQCACASYWLRIIIPANLIGQHLKSLANNCNLRQRRLNRPSYIDARPRGCHGGKYWWTVSWDVTPCTVLLKVTVSVELDAYIFKVDWRWKQKVPPKRRLSIPHYTVSHQRRQGNTCILFLRMTWKRWPYCVSVTCDVSETTCNCKFISGVNARRMKTWFTEV